MRKYFNKYTLPKLWRILFFRCHLCGKEGLEPYTRTITFFRRGCLCIDCFWHDLYLDEEVNEDGEILNLFDEDAEEEEEDYDYEDEEEDGREDPEVPDEE